MPVQNTATYTSPAALLRGQRTSRYWSQLRLAEETGLTRRRIIAIETGKVTNLRITEAEAIERALGIPITVWRTCVSDNDL